MTSEAACRRVVLAALRTTVYCQQPWYFCYDADSVLTARTEIAEKARKARKELSKNLWQLMLDEVYAIA